MSKRITTVLTLATVSAMLLASPLAGASLKDRIAGLNPFSNQAEQSLQQNTVRFLNKKAAKHIRVESITATRTATGNLQVNVLLYNRAKKPMQLAVRSLFFDEQRMLAESAGVWRTVHLQPKSVASFSSRSMTQTEAASFILEVQGDAARGYR